MLFDGKERKETMTLQNCTGIVLFKLFSSLPFPACSYRKIKIDDSKKTKCSH